MAGETGKVTAAREVRKASCTLIGHCPRVTGWQHLFSLLLHSPPRITCCLCLSFYRAFVPKHCCMTCLWLSPAACTHRRSAWVPGSSGEGSLERWASTPMKNALPLLFPISLKKKKKTLLFSSLPPRKYFITLVSEEPPQFFPLCQAGYTQMQFPLNFHRIYKAGFRCHLQSQGLKSGKGPRVGLRAEWSTQGWKAYQEAKGPALETQR